MLALAKKVVLISSPGDFLGVHRTQDDCRRTRKKLQPFMPKKSIWMQV